MSAHLRVAVVGGGITGLTAAYELERLAAEHGIEIAITLLEATNRLGGKVQTERIDGFLLEQGPDSLLARKVEARQLCADLGLADRLTASSGDFQGTYVLHRGRLEPLPESTLLIAPTRIRPYLNTRLLSPFGKIRAGFDLFLPAREGDEDESLESFVARRFGREIADRIAVPLLASVYGGGKGDLSVQATFPELHRLESSHRSVLLGLRTMASRRGGTTSRPFVTILGGLHTLVERLVESLKTTKILRQTEVRQVTPVSPGSETPSYRLTLSNDDELLADAVVLATPANVTSRLVDRMAPPAASVLSTMTDQPALVVAVAFPQERIAHPMLGTGFLVPADERRRLIACTWVTRKWPHASDPDKMLMRCYLGGSDLQRLMASPDEAVVDVACAELAEILGTSGKPLLSRVYRWEHGIPRYAPGHLARVKQATEALDPFPGIVLAGASYRGIGVPDCIRQGLEAARDILTQTARIESRPGTVTRV